VQSLWINTSKACQTTIMHIYTIVYNNASFLELQYLSFRKHCPLQSFTVIDNSNNAQTKLEVAEFAGNHGCYVVYPTSQRFDNAGFSHQAALKTATQLLANSLGISIICDPDVFLLGQLPLHEIYTHDFSGLMQGTDEVQYLWPGFLVINPLTLQAEIDLRGALVNPNNLDDFIIPDTAAGWSWESYPEQLKTYTPTDSGGLLCRYIRKHSPKILEFSLAFMGDMCYDPSVMPEHLRSKYNNLYNFWVINGNVLHSGRLSNWDNRPSDEVTAKSELVKDIVRYYIDNNKD